MTQYERVKAEFESVVDEIWDNRAQGKDSSHLYELRNQLAREMRELKEAGK